ncbi:MAG: manganese efflux pump MntP family protein [bacterium]
MKFYELMLLSVGLSMDAFAISLTCGIYAGRERMKMALRSGLFFGLAQALMPVIGYFLGNAFESLIKSFDHWVAFVILFAIGVKMIYESFKEDECKNRIDASSFKVMLLLAVATSIDALACGISIALLEGGILIPALIIGTVTFLISFIGVVLGDKLGKSFRRGSEILGGSMLIFIGLKILLEHL